MALPRKRVICRDKYIFFQLVNFPFSLPFIKTFIIRNLD